MVYCALEVSHARLPHLRDVGQGVHGGTESTRRINIELKISIHK